MTGKILEKKVASEINFAIEVLLTAHKERGARILDSFEKAIYDAMPISKRPSREIYTRILLEFDNYVSENFNHDVNHRCFPGDLELNGHPQKIKDYIARKFAI